MNRRKFLASAAVLPVAACALAGRTNGGENGVALRDVSTLRVERHDPIGGLCRYVAATATRTVAAPVFTARPGDVVDCVVENRLPQPTTVHFHGLTLPAAADGAGFEPLAPGESRRVRFEVLNRAGLYWLHPHPHGFTGAQLNAGLVAMLVVTDGEDAALDRSLGLLDGNRLALTLADARFNGAGREPYAPSGEECVHGWFGNRMLVNGMPDASFDVAQGWVRLQLLHACNARGLLVQFIDASSPSAGPIPFQLLGTDGGLLARPRALERVFLHTAERIDVAIDLTGRREVAALSAPFDARHQMAGRMPARRHDGAAHAYAPLAAGVVCGSAGTGGLADGAAMRLFMLRAAQAGRAGSVPAELSSLPDVAPVAVPTRRLRLDFDDEAGFVIDNTPYRADEPGIIVPRGAAEVWELRNSPISMPHPMHLHGFAWRVLRRQGTFGPARALAVESGGRLPTDLGVKDTVVLWPNETLWLQADFALPDDAAFRGPQRYMLHCHNLEHEDGGMMRNVTVGP